MSCLMSISVTRKALWNTVAIAGLVAGAAALSGCTAIGARAFGDPTVTGSASRAAPGNVSQPMPSLLGQSSKVAAGPYVPPNPIGGGAAPAAVAPTAAVTQNALMPIDNSRAVQTQALPPAIASTGATQMPAQQTLAPVKSAPQTLGAPTPQVATAAPVAPASQGVAVMPQNAYVHVIESGESLYSIARKYNVTAQAIVQGNGFSSPDKIFVGQKIMIPGMKSSAQPQQVAAVGSDDAPTQSPVATLVKPPATTAAIANPALLESNTPVSAPANAAPVQVSAVGEPKMSGAEKFRWPASGKVINDFSGTKGTGINIEVPEGTSVRAAENGTVIYVGSGVEGYGNLVLIRHPNGYVSAYAHLKAMTVTKGDVVNRGDSIGQAGMTGSVSRPQLHFELRKGATPVDPMPLLAS